MTLRKSPTNQEATHVTAPKGIAMTWTILIGSENACLKAATPDVRRNLRWRSLRRKLGLKKWEAQPRVRGFEFVAFWSLG